MNYKLALLLLLLAFGGSARAQTSSDMRELSGDLCGCLERVDARASNSTLETSVRNCLEDAVVHHPGTVNALLRRNTSSDTKAVALGRMLGTLLERDCAGFGSIKIRLQQIQSTGAHKKGTT